MRILLLNQCFYPDVASSGQHLSDLAIGLASRGHEVTVVASRRGYDDPRIKFEAREVWNGVKVVRAASTGFGKKSRWRRAADFGSFLIACAIRLLFISKPDLIVAMTTPPLICFLAALVARLRRAEFVFWVMDLNPDQAEAAGWLRSDSPVARLLGGVLRYSLRRASKIIVLDRFMRERVRAKGAPAAKIAVIPPWSHDDVVRYDETGRQSFRARHGLSDKFVVMYSGNHSPCHPLDTLLEAARELANEPRIAFCFVGGGSEFERVRVFAQEHSLANVICLPYQPLNRLAESLSAGDLHVVVMGDRFAGIIHPCKVYNVLSVGAPFLYIGPPESHVTDLLGQLPTAFSARHGDRDAVVRCILEAAQRGEPHRSGSSLTVAAHFSKDALLPRIIDAVESVRDHLPAPGSTAPEMNAPAA